jgi:hypothetical protein
MPRVIPVRTLTIFLVKEQVGETEIIDPEEAAQCTETPVSLVTRQVGSLFAKQTPTTPPVCSNSSQNPGLECRGCDEHQWRRLS